MPFPLRAPAALGLLLLLGIGAGCAVNPTTAKPVPERLAELESEREVVKRELTEIRTDIARLSQNYYREKLCKSGKVQQFLSAVAMSSPTACAPLQLEDALRFMSNELLGFALLRTPDDKSDRPAGLSSLHEARENHLRTVVLNPQELYPSTRLLILFQPAAETSEAEHFAREVSKSLINKIRTEMLPADFRNMTILGPFPLPCVMKSEQSLQKMYSSSNILLKLSETLPTEPTEKEPRLRLFVFRSDC